MVSGAQRRRWPLDHDHRFARRRQRRVDRCSRSQPGCAIACAVRCGRARPVRHSLRPSGALRRWPLGHRFARRRQRRVDRCSCSQPGCAIVCAARCGRARLVRHSMPPKVDESRLHARRVRSSSRRAKLRAIWTRAPTGYTRRRDEPPNWLLARRRPRAPRLGAQRRHWPLDPAGRAHRRARATQDAVGDARLSNRSQCHLHWLYLLVLPLRASAL
jgi:hypothetical protein